MVMCSKCGADFSLSDGTAGLLPLCPTCQSAGESGKKRPAWRQAQDDLLGQLKEAYGAIREHLEATGWADDEAMAVHGPFEQKRAHERHEVALPMQFQFLRDRTSFEGTVTDISQGGCRFVTRRALEVGQILQVVIERDQGKGTIHRIRNLIELRRVLALEDGGYDVGGRFIRRSGLERSDRRHHPRAAATGTIFFRREGSSFLSHGRLRDISQSGLCLQTDQNIQEGEKLEVELQTEPPAFVEAQVNGTVKVVRVRARSRFCHELGCAFLKKQILPRETQMDLD